MAGSQTTDTKIPEWLESHARGTVEQSNEAAKIGYVPYYGPDVAAFTPTQNAAFANNNAAAEAFGLAAPQGNGMPQAMEYAGGVKGYSSQPMFEQSQRQLYDERPNQYGLLSSFSVDPVKGDYVKPQPKPAAQGGGGSAGKGGGQASQPAPQPGANSYTLPGGGTVYTGGI